MTVRLGVNIDHVATLRQARGGHEPEPIHAALVAQGAGAQGLTVHLRADRRHIQERDVRLLKELLVIPLNVECAASTEAFETLVPHRPDWVTLVPETREEITTQGGLDAVFLQEPLRRLIREYHAHDIHVSLFLDPQPEQIKAAAKLEADAVELCTGPYSDLGSGEAAQTELGRIRKAAELGAKFRMLMLAGHGLTLQNVQPIAAIPEIEELNIGHSIIARSVLVGLPAAVQEMLAAIRRARRV